MAKSKLRDKTHARSSEWAYAFEHIEDFISRQEVVERFQQTVELTAKVTRGHKCGFGWSGGKESVVLEDIMQRLGIKTCCIGFNSCLSYPSFVRYVSTHMPQGCEVFDFAERINWKTMQEKGMEAFSDDLREYSHWINISDRTAYPEFCKRNGIDMFIMGKRKGDNNICGKAPWYITTAKNRPYVTFSPMAEWTTEEVLGYIRYFKGGYRALAPQYTYRNGWHNGSDSPIYLDLEGRTRHQMWADVWMNSHELVERAAEYIDSAREYINSLTSD